MNTAASGWPHVRHEVLVGGLSNAIFNGLIAWLLLRRGPGLGWGGDNSFVVDVVATGLLLPFIVALIVIPLQRGKLRKGRLQAIDLGPASLLQRVADRLPGSTVKTALWFGVFGMCVIAPLTLAGFHLLGVEAFAPAEYAIFKGVWAGAVAAALVIPMVLVALRAPDALH